MFYVKIFTVIQKVKRLKNVLLLLLKIITQGYKSDSLLAEMPQIRTRTVSKSTGSLWAVNSPPENVNSLKRALSGSEGHSNFLGGERIRVVGFKTSRGVSSPFPEDPEKSLSV